MVQMVLGFWAQGEREDNKPRRETERGRPTSTKEVNSRTVVWRDGCDVVQQGGGADQPGGFLF